MGIVLYCNVLYCIVLYCIVLYCVVSVWDQLSATRLIWLGAFLQFLGVAWNFCIVLYCIVLCCIVLCCICLRSAFRNQVNLVGGLPAIFGSCLEILYCILLYCIVLYCIVLYCIVMYCIVLYY